MLNFSFDSCYKRNLKKIKILLIINIYKNTKKKYRKFLTNINKKISVFIN